MKKLFLSSLVLLFFSASMILFQLSCSKESEGNDNNTKQLNKIVFVKMDNNSGVREFWVANLDGSNQTLIPITLPANRKWPSNLAITPDGSKIVFTLEDSSDGRITYIYTANIDGSNVTQIIGTGTRTDYSHVTVF